MMPAADYINLLPRQEKQAQRPGFRTIAVAVFVLVWIILFGLKFKQRWDLEAKLGSLTAQKKIVEGQVASIRASLGITDGTGTNPDRASLIQNLLKERVLWSEVFKQFSRIIPRGVWFDSLEGNSVGTAQIKIRGGSFNYTSVADFMLAMEQSGYFAKPQLLYAQKTVVQGREVINFEIVCGIKKARGRS